MIKKCLHGIIVLMLLMLGSQCAKEELTPVISEPVAEEFSLENIEDETIRNFLDYSYVSALNPNLIQGVDSRDEEALIHRAIEEIYEMDKQKGFIKNMVRKYGYPIWDKSTILPAHDGRAVLFTPLAFTDGDEITSFLTGIPLPHSFHFRLIKKEKIDKYIGKDEPKEPWDNLRFSVLSCVAVDQDLFDNPRQEYIVYFPQFLNQRS